MGWLQQLVDAYKSDWPVLAAFLLGLMTAISPCPLATNITATAYLSRDLTNRKQVFLNGLCYTLGRIVSYTGLGLIFYFGASQFRVARALQNVGGFWLGVALVVAGFFMLDVVRLRIPLFEQFAPQIDDSRPRKGYWNAFLLGMAFALAFCPFSGVLYFGILIPMTIASPSGLLLPPLFAVATGLPVIIIAYLLAFSMSNIGRFYNSIKSIEQVFKRLVAVVFMLVGIYYIITYL